MRGGTHEAHHAGLLQVNGMTHIQLQRRLLVLWRLLLLCGVQVGG